MNRTLSVLVLPLVLQLPLLLLPTLLSGCTGGDGPDAGPRSSAIVDAGPQLPGCTDDVIGNPGCGGTVEGTWTVVTGCPVPGSTIKEVADLLASCEGATVTITDMNASGTMTLQDGNFDFSVSGDISADVTVAANCLTTFGGCVAIEQSVPGTTCENVEGTCNCNVKAPYQNIDNGTYVLDENAAVATVTSAANGLSRDYQYCVSNDVLTVQEFFDQGLGPILVETP